MTLEFLDLLETVRAESADVQKLFGDAGTGVRGQAHGKTYAAKLVETVNFVADVVSGKKPSYLFKEAMTTSDFPLLFGDVLDRQLLAAYREWTPVWKSYVAMKTVPDFRNVSRYIVDGAETILALVPEQTAYPSSLLTEGRYQYHVNKYGRRMPFSWEAIINDDLDALKDIPIRFGKAARRSEDWFATIMHADANGPDVTFYSNAHLNKITIASGALVDNPVLGIPGLQAAFQKLGAMVDTGGDPIIVEGVVLEVPPALEVTALNILNATQLWFDPAGSGVNMLVTANWMRIALNWS